MGGRAGWFSSTGRDIPAGLQAGWCRCRICRETICLTSTKPRYIHWWVLKRGIWSLALVWLSCPVTDDPGGVPMVFVKSWLGCGVRRVCLFSSLRT